MNSASNTKHIMQPNDWWKSAVFYQIYPRSFYDSNNDGIGDLKGIIEKLDHLNDGNGGGLGIDAIWLSPFFPSPQADFGYDVSDYCDVDPIFGSLKDFDSLVNESHMRQIRVVIDLRRGVEPETVRRQLYKLTSIESSWSFLSASILLSSSFLA